MKNAQKLFGIFAFIAVISFSTASCDNGTTNNTTGSMNEILRVDKEVRDLFFYSSNGVTRDSPNDSGSVAAVCTDYAAEFYYRYTGEVYLVAISYGGGQARWYTVDEWLPASAFNWRTKAEFGLNSAYRNGVWEYDGVLRDARLKVVWNETWTEWTHSRVVGHMWCVAVVNGKWYLVDPTWRDNSLESNPITEIPAPGFAK
jgi:hypothetical protein